MAPATVTVVVMVESDGESRALEVVAESEEFFRSSQVELVARVTGGDPSRVAPMASELVRHCEHGLAVKLTVSPV